jgi:NAD+ kinase
MKSAAILSKEGSVPLEITGKLVPWLRERGVEVLLEAETAGAMGDEKAAGPDRFFGADMAVVLGGDGTMLRAARLFAGRSTPLLGVNLGGLGFITEVHKDELFDALDRILRGGCPTEERMMLRAHVIRGGGRAAEFTALNDVVINKGKLARLIVLETSVNGSHVNVLKSDGLIVSTPTGSTAYSLSAGGPIVCPTVECLLFTPICPHTLTNRPIVLGGDALVEITLKSDAKEDEVLLTLDGQSGVTLMKDDVVKVSKSPHRTTLLLPTERDHFHILRTKLRWGER